VPYKPDQSAQFTAKDAGYQQIGEGFYMKPGAEGSGTEVYLPQDKASDLGKALAGAGTFTPAAGDLSAALAAQPVPSGQEAGATPGAGPATDITPTAVAAGTQTETPTAAGSTPTPDATQPVPGTGFKEGGTVPETGRYTLHAGEVVLPADRAEAAPEDIRDRGPLQVAHHEESETVQDEQTGKWVNVYGKGIKGKAGMPLPYEGNQYDTVEEAVDAAKKRSLEEGQKGHAEAEKPWYVSLTDGIPSQDLDGTDPNVRRLAFTPDDVEAALDAGERPIMTGRGVLNLPPSALRGQLKKAQDMQFKDPLRNPGVIAMANKAQKAQLKPEGDTMPGMGERVLRGQEPGYPQRPRFPGDQGRNADQRLEDIPKASDIPYDRTAPGVEPPPGIMDEQGMQPMPMVPNNPQPLPMQTLGGPGVRRAMMLAQGPGADFARQDKMLEGLDRGTIAPSSLGGVTRTLRKNLTPPAEEGLMNRPGGATTPQPQPGLLEQAIRRMRG